MTSITADSQAIVWKVLVQKGDSIAVGETVMILEAMKMEFPIESSVEGVVTDLFVGVGDAVNEGDALVSVE
ncbi:acetyl-CoA carboxylase biotin carboxyl carrier protein subunit [Arthrobacter sp. 2MCAF15]|uniref:acetyl-CoA carboxylase biotin carboxyl carrier protein subunit n=1 Tax=Arthrobacter sp. 2MCAF15 TaxID=3232984 RepID=UPI003F904601